MALASKKELNSMGEMVPYLWKPLIHQKNEVNPTICCWDNAILIQLTQGLIPFRLLSMQRKAWHGLGISTFWLCVCVHLCDHMLCLVVYECFWHKAKWQIGYNSAVFKDRELKLAEKVGHLIWGKLSKNLALLGEIQSPTGSRPWTSVTSFFLQILPFSTGIC